MARVSQSRRFLAGLIGALAVALAAGALAPPTASAGIIPNPIDAVKGLVGVPGDVAGKLGATVLQEALEWLLGGIKAAITLELVKFLTAIELPVGSSLAQVAGPMIVIGGFFLVVGLITSIGDGYREIIAGTDTAPRVIGQAIFRVIGLALLLGAWYWIVPLAADIANGMSGYVLSDDAVAQALRRTFAADQLLKVGFPLLGLLTAIALAMSILTLVVVKFILVIAFACLYVGGPAFIGFAALPRVGSLPLAIVTRGLFTLTLIPFLWTVVFVAWGGVSAAVFDTATGDAKGVMGGLMGPGLFLAGLIVMLAATKKVLTMATFGLQLSVPGGGLGRSAVRSASVAAVARGLGAKLAASTTSPTSGAEASAIPRRPDADTRGPRSGRGAVQTGATSPVAGRSEFRQLPVDPPREEQAAWEQAERLGRELDANAIASVKGGVWEGREAPPEAARVLRQEIDGLRRASAASSAEHLIMVRDDLPTADRSAFVASAKRSIEAHPSDAEKAWREFRDAGVNQYAGRDLDAQQAKAVSTVLSSSPETVWEAFQVDYGRYRPSRAGGDAPTRTYDQRLMDQHGGLEAVRREAQQRGTQTDRDDGLPF